MYIPNENWGELEKDGYEEEELDEVLYIAVEEFDEEEAVS